MSSFVINTAVVTQLALLVHWSHYDYMTPLSPELLQRSGAIHPFFLRPKNGEYFPVLRRHVTVQTVSTRRHEAKVKHTSAPPWLILPV